MVLSNNIVSFEPRAYCEIMFQQLWWSSYFISAAFLFYWIDVYLLKNPTEVKEYISQRKNQTNLITAVENRLKTKEQNETSPGKWITAYNLIGADQNGMFMYSIQIRNTKFQFNNARYLPIFVYPMPMHSAFGSFPTLQPWKMCTENFN